MINRGEYAEEKRNAGKITFHDAVIPGNRAIESAGEAAIMTFIRFLTSSEAMEVSKDNGAVRLTPKGRLSSMVHIYR
ncbi:hypothetical protein F4694_003084 [Bacillus niacini]|uniref:Uncharacterized protein n=1 Tax=Neobacillus niacini TaxID=86668 RepID=A0A852TGJ5_9BACI|nr:hypothetical protein [Neobacillus niacini]NYE06304.1 hypothetical protein [Neobacillus niacini]